MGKSKGSRITITLECSCKNINSSKKKNSVCRYTTVKNKRNTPSRLTLRKFCSHCNKHEIFKEIK